MPSGTRYKQLTPRFARPLGQGIIRNVLLHAQYEDASGDDAAGRRSEHTEEGDSLGLSEEEGYS